MNSLRTLVLFFCGAVSFLPSLSNAGPEMSPWNIRSRDGKGVVEYDINTGVVSARGGAIVTYTGEDGKEAEISAGEMSLDQRTGEVLARGSVFLRSEGQIWIGDELRYNFRSRDIGGSNFRTGRAPFYASGLSLGASLSNQVYSATNAVITSDDLSEPFYRVEASEITIKPGNEILAQKAKIYVGQIPVFYLPKYRLDLQQHERFWVTNPGYRSLWGNYLLTDYNWLMSESLATAIHLDYRSRRGFGTGPRVRLDLGRYGRMFLDTYWLHDDDPSINAAGRVINPDRHRLNFSYEANIRTNFSVTAVFRYQGDPFILRDFFEQDYQANTQPASFAEADYQWDNFSLNLLVMPRVNDFFERVERLPELQFTGLRQQLGDTPFYYESQSSAGYLKHEFIDNVRASYAATRVDSFHQILLPKTVFGWLNVAPRVGGRYTYYSETEGGFVAQEADRWVFNTGIQTSFKLSRTWADRDFPLFESSGMRHVMEPSVNYVFVPSPNQRPTDLPQFDTTIPTLRLLPIDYPDYNSIDSVDSQNTLRFGLRNTVQTKREGRTDTLFNWNLFTDWNIRHRPDQNTFSDIYSDFDFQPREWLTLTSENRYDLGNGHLAVADHRFIIRPGGQWSASLGHRYVKSSPAIGIGHNLLIGTYYYRLNENWGFNIRHVFEGRDGVAEDQTYSIYRDFRSWVGALSVRLRNNRTTTDDFTIGFTLSSKALPRIGLGGDSVSPTYLIGGR